MEKEIDFTVFLKDKKMENKRPKYKIWDNLYDKWYEPTYEAYKGNLEDLTLTPCGELIMRKMNKNGKIETRHESMFPDRFEVVLEENWGQYELPTRAVETKEPLQCSNQNNTFNFEGTINYELVK